jgi:hypothetical protein
LRALSCLALCAGLASSAALAQEITSAYSQLDPDADCSVFASSGGAEGDWANMTCAGYRGYPVIIYYSDARESVFYGFPPDGDLAPTWESFQAFNRTGPTIEWRIERDGSRETPFATIHRWFVSDIDFPDEEVEVLVVQKVGQIHGRQGCVVGYVAATGNPGANEAARRIADTQARDFVCGADQPAVVSGSVPVPPFSRRD